MSTCSNCGGRGRVSRDCPNCNGQGRVPDYNNWDGSNLNYNSCSSCGGSGYKEESCSRCGGSGQIDDGSSSSGGSSSSYTPSSSGGSSSRSGGGGRNRTDQQMEADYNSIKDCYNKCDWQGLLDAYQTATQRDYYKYFQKLESRVENVWYMVETARAKTDPDYDYVRAFYYSDWGEHKNAQSSDSDRKIIKKGLYNIAKNLFQRKHGREITDSELTQLHLNYLEQGMSENINKKYIGSAWSKRDEWEQITGREMTKEEQIRIIGKHFPKRPKEESSSSSSSYSGGNDVVPRGKFLSIVLGLVCGLGATLAVGWVIVNMTGMAKLPTIPALIMIVVGFIATFDSWRWKKNVLFLVMLALTIPGWLIMFRIIPEHVNLRHSIKSATTQTTQSANTNPSAEIIKNVNFRKGPSTNDEVIRQLKQGDIVILTGEVSGGWTQVTRDGEKGWVSNEYLKVWEK